MSQSARRLFVTAAAVALVLGSAASIALAQGTPAAPAAPARPAGALGTVAGKVTEKAGAEPVAYANVIILGTKQGAMTDENGNYRIVGVPVGRVQVRVQVLGFEAKIQEVQVNAGAVSSLNFDFGSGSHNITKTLEEI